MLFPGGSDGKESACNAGDLGLIPGLGKSPGEGNGNPRQYSGLENSMDGGIWQATVHGVVDSDAAEWRARWGGRSLLWLWWWAAQGPLGPRHSFLQRAGAISDPQFLSLSSKSLLVKKNPLAPLSGGAHFQRLVSEGVERPCPLASGQASPVEPL